MVKTVIVTITLEDRRITLEGPEDFVRDEVERLIHAESDSSTSTRHLAKATDTERELIERKMPSGHAEIVAVLAWWLRENGVSEFGPEEMRKAYIRAKIRPPKVVAQALRDARNKYEFIEQGSKRGLHRLSPHGERTVLFDLPRAH